jgi:hypothetical protein
MTDPRLKSFKNFLYLCFKHLGVGQPTECQYAIASKLQKGPKRLIISAFRGFGKSWITAVYVLYRLYHDRTLNILVVSASKARSDDFSTFCFKLMREIPELNSLLPDEKHERFSKVAFDVAGAPASQSTSVRSMGIFSQLTGARADIIIADDVETPGTSETQGMREKLAERVKEFEAILKPLDDTRIIFLGTPQTEDSVYNDLVKRGYTRILWTARYPDPKWMQHNGHELAEELLQRIEADPSLQTGYGLDGLRGAPTDPARFDEEELQSREAAYGRAGFSLQFQVDTTLSDQDRYPLKLRDLIVMDFGEMAPDHPVWGPGKPLEDLRNIGFRGDHFYGPVAVNGAWRTFEGSIMAIDPAGRGADELAYAVVKQLNGFLYVAECYGMREGFETRNLEALALIAKKHKVNKIIIESNFGDGMFSRLLTPVLGKIYPCTIEDIRSNKQKEKRIIDTLEPVISNHKLVVSKELIQKDGTVSEFNDLNRQLMFQLTRITRDRGALVHDDRLDVLAIGVGYWKDSLARDIDKAKHEQRLREVGKQIDKYWSALDKRHKSQKNWLGKIIGGR